MLQKLKNYVNDNGATVSGFCNETTGRVTKSLNRKMNYRFQDTGWSFNLVPSLYGMAVFYMQGLRLFNNYFEKRS